MKNRILVFFSHYMTAPKALLHHADAAKVALLRERIQLVVKMCESDV